MFVSCRGENMVTRDSASKQIVCSGTFGPHTPWKRTWRRLIQRSKTRCNYTGRAKSTTRRLIVCTPWHIVHQEAFETTAHETLLVVLLLGNRKETFVSLAMTLTVGKVKSIGSRISPIRETFRGDQHSHRSFTRSDTKIHSIFKEPRNN